MSATTALRLSTATPLQRVLAGLLIVLLVCAAVLAPIAEAHELMHLPDDGSSLTQDRHPSAGGLDHTHPHPLLGHDSALGDALHAFAHAWLGCTPGAALLPCTAVEAIALRNPAPRPSCAEPATPPRLDILLRPPIA